MDFFSARSAVTLLVGLGALLGVAGCSAGVDLQGAGDGTEGADDGSGGQGGAGAAGEPAVPCESSAACPDLQYCRFEGYGCGVDNPVGTCVPVPLECGYVPTQVCACDGKVERQDCPGLRRVDLSANGACTPPEGTFACGFTFCKAGIEYCVRRVYPGDVKFSCNQLPAACDGSDTCACVAATDTDPCGGSSCEEDSAGHAVVTCGG